MVRVTYTTEALGQTFTNVKTVKNIAAFDLFNLALHHGKAVIIASESEHSLAESDYAKYSDVPRRVDLIPTV